MSNEELAPPPRPAGPTEALTPQVTVQDLGALIRSNASMAVQLAENMQAWGYLREVLSGDAPAPVIIVKIPVPGRPDPLYVERDLSQFSRDEIESILMPLLAAEGLAIMNGCRQQGNMADRMNNLCDILNAEAAQEQQPPEPAPTPPPATQRQQRPAQPGATPR